MNIAYVRVSTAEQNDERQREALEKHNIEKWFTEKASGKDTHRPKLQELLDFVREGDTVFVHDFSRLARSTKDLLEIIDLLTKRGARLVSNKESFDTSTPTGKLMVTMIGAINEFERMNLLERQREGIAIAKRQGKYIGRNQVNLDPEQWREVYERYTKGELTLSALARELDISRPTAYKLIEKEKAPK